MKISVKIGNERLDRVWDMISENTPDQVNYGGLHQKHPSGLVRLLLQNAVLGEPNDDMSHHGGVFQHPRDSLSKAFLNLLFNETI